MDSFIAHILVHFQLHTFYTMAFSSFLWPNNAAYKIISDRFTGAGMERDKSDSFVSNTNNILAKQNEENGKNALLCHGAMYRCVCMCVRECECVQPM